MIRYALTCDREHGFEAWFGSSDDYDDQAERGLVECPFCASKAVRKQIMAPAVTGTKAQKSVAPPEPQLPALTEAAAAPADSPQAKMLEVLAKMKRYVETHFENVGDRFAQEARDIHDGVSDDRAIYGQATGDEVRELIEDGVPIAPLPFLGPPTAKLN